LKSTVYVDRSTHPMDENILFNFLMFPYVSYVVNFIYNYKQRILNHIRNIKAHKFLCLSNRSQTDNFYCVI